MAQILPVEVVSFDIPPLAKKLTPTVVQLPILLLLIMAFVGCRLAHASRFVHSRRFEIMVMALAPTLFRTPGRPRGKTRVVVLIARELYS